MKSNQNSSHGKVGNSYKSPAIGNLTIKSVNLTASDILTWKKAVDAARSSTSPRRNLLYDLFHNVILDGHLAAVMQKRATSVLNKKVTWESSNIASSTSTRIREIIESPWFYQIIGHIMETISWGHSLLELVVEKSSIKSVELINRYNVLPEYGFVSYAYHNHHPSPTSGIYYRNNPVHEDYLIEIGKPKDYGLLMIATPYVLYKRNAIGDWAQFAEIFGMPFRVGRYNPFDDRTRKLLEDGLDKMGSAAWSVIPDGTSVEFHDNNAAGKSEVFENLAVTMNEELSKIYLGGTMTIDSGSSLSQGKVHGQGEDDINLSDIIWVEHILNESVRPKLAKLLNIPGLLKGMFRYTETNHISLKDRINIDMQVSQRIPFPEDYWYKTYGIEMPKNGKFLPIAGNAYKRPTETKKKEPVVPPKDQPSESKPKEQQVHNKYQRLDELQKEGLTELQIKNLDELQKQDYRERHKPLI